MPGSRALKEVTMCKVHPKSTKKESVSKPQETQFKQTGPKNTAPNYPQWHLGSGGGSVKGGV